MALGYPKTGNMVSVTLSDGTGSPVTYALDQDRGTYTIGDIKPGLRNSTMIQRKGQPVAPVFTDAAAASLTMEFLFDAFSKAAGGTILDWIFKDGALSARIGTFTPAGATDLLVPFGCDAIIVVEGTNYGDSADGTITVRDWLITGVSWNAAENEAITVSVTGEVWGAFEGDTAIARAT